nr:MAG TPA: hypothetical protein [Caudoviricetes sp.]
MLRKRGVQTDKRTIIRRNKILFSGVLKSHPLSAKPVFINILQIK